MRRAVGSFIQVNVRYRCVINAVLRTDKTIRLIGQAVRDDDIPDRFAPRHPYLGLTGIIHVNVAGGITQIQG